MMKVCLVHSDMQQHLYRCLLHDLKIPYVVAPKAGKYTRQTGAAVASEGMCEDLLGLLGSLCEGWFLGADCAIITSPCGECDSRKAAQSLSESLHQSGMELRRIVPVSAAGKAKELFLFLKEERGASIFLYYEAKRRFFECRALLEHYEVLRREAFCREQYQNYICQMQQNIENATSLLELKIQLSAFGKKLEKIAQYPQGESNKKPLCYAENRQFETFFGKFKKSG